MNDASDKLDNGDVQVKHIQIKRDHFSVHSDHSMTTIVTDVLPKLYSLID